MTIVELHRFAVCGPRSELERVMAGLQALGCAHLELPKDVGPLAERRRPQLMEALRELRAVRHRRRPVLDREGFELESVVAAVLVNREARREREDEREILQRRIDDVEPWGDFELPPVDDLSGHRLWFYRVPLHQMRHLRDLELPWQQVHKDNRASYVVVISPGQPPPGDLPVPRTRIGKRSLRVLNRRLDEVERELEDLEAERQSLTRWIALLEWNVARAEDRSALKQACRAAREHEAVFEIQGWVPSRHLAALQRWSKQRGIAFLAAPPVPGERPPTLLENRGTFAGGQDLVGFYQLPGYADWDPSSIVSVSFALFFAMILADAGYALLFAGLLLYFWRALGRSAGGRRFRPLAVTTVMLSLGYGVLVGSYFGASPHPDSWLADLHVLDLRDFQSMMRVAILIGCVHITLANVLAARAAVSWPRRLPFFGWILVTAGALLLWLGPYAVPAWACVGVGLVTIVVFSSSRPATSFKSLLMRVVDGLLSVTNLSKLFGDVLSYLRLFALGLASSSLAITFNGLADGIRESMPGVGVLWALLLLIVGHTINLGLAVIGGFIHGLRLNFIEFFNWGMREEGRPFRAFARKENQR